MARYLLTTNPPTNFDELVAGQVALRIAAATDPHAKLIDLNEECEWGVIDNRVEPVFGSGPHWDRLDRPGEKEFVQLWVIQDRWNRMRQILGRQPTQTEMDVATDVIQWLGTSVGMGFYREAHTRFCKKLGS